MLKYIIILTIIYVLSGCSASTARYVEFKRGSQVGFGYNQIKHSDYEYWVEHQGRRGSSWREYRLSKYYCFLRAAEIGRVNGYTYFIVEKYTDNSLEVKIEFIEDVNSEGVMVLHPWRRHIVNPHVSLMVRFYSGAPKKVDDDLFVIKDVMNDIRGKCLLNLPSNERLFKIRNHGEFSNDENYFPPLRIPGMVYDDYLEPLDSDDLIKDEDEFLEMIRGIEEEGNDNGKME